MPTTAYFDTSALVKLYLRALPDTVLVSFDRDLNRAARLLGFSLLDFIPT